MLACISHLSKTTFTRTVTTSAYTMGRLQGKNVFITGASAGIGEATAMSFAREGSNLILVARRMERLESVKKKILFEAPHVKIHIANLDVRNSKAIETFLPSIPIELSQIDILVNNVGMVLGHETVGEIKTDDIDTMIDTNVKSLINVTNQILPQMKKRNSGHIFMLGSIAGIEAYANGSIYCATKFAVKGFTRSLRRELVSTNIKLTEIAPGMVDTEFSTVRFRGDKEKADKVYEGIKPLTAEDIADIIVFSASRPEHVQIANMVVFPVHQAGAGPGAVFKEPSN